MKASLKILIAVFACLSVFRTPMALAADKTDVSKFGVWNDSKGLTNRLHFRMDNGDVVMTKVWWMGPKRMSLEIHRRGETASTEQITTDLKNATEVGAPNKLLQSAPDTLKNLIKLVPLSDWSGKVNVLIFKGDNGLLIVGQINAVSPAAYFTTFIKSEKGQSLELPSSMFTYILPSKNSGAIGLQENVDMGIMLGFKDGVKLAHLISTPLLRTKNAGASTASHREARAQDLNFDAIPFKDGQFIIPELMRGELTTSNVVTATTAMILKGVDRLRANHVREDALKASLKTTIFGQDAAIDRLVFNYGETLTNGMGKPKVLVLMGPSGVGKTYIGQEFARAVYGSPDKFLEVPGSEYGAHLGSLDSQKLFGTSGGVQGGTKGELPEWLQKTNGEGVLLINEGDKMHRDVWLKMMELLDQGKITGQNGKPINATKLTILITTNRGATRMFPAAVAGWSQAELDKQLESFSQDNLKGYYLAKDGLQDDKSLPREVLNRIDEYIAFGPFSKESAIKVAFRRGFELAQDYEREYLVSVTIDPKALEQIALSGWTAADDARQIRRAVGSTMKSALDIGVKNLGVKNGEAINLTFDTSDKRAPAYRVTVGDRSELIKSRVLVSNNPLKNKDLSTTLVSLADNMNTEVIGQKVTIESVAKASISHAMRPEKNRPLVIGLLGVSGNGKTETARALAKFRYGDHISIISMGEISSPSDFDKKFGSSAQFQGGDIARDFEVALKNNPDGGVIVLDEISNMGGGDPGMRAALLMKLYNIFEEGTFTSPIDNKVYRLEKYTFVLTGNESEQLFNNVSSDDMLKAIWEENRDPAKVRELLTNAKFPPAFINRAKWFLMKPLLSYEVHAVTAKLWKREVTAFETENPGLKISVTPSFFDRVTTAYFSPDKGGRAIRDIFEDRIGDLLFHSLMSADIDTTDLRGVEVVVGLDDNHLKQPFRTNNSPVRKVSFIATVQKDGKVLHTKEIDATALATEQVLLGKESALSVAIHEMGHAVTNIEEISGERFAYVTIRGGKMGDIRYYGYARYTPIEGAMLNPDHHRTVLRIAQLWAGLKAQELAGFEKDAGWANDLQKIRQHATAYLTKWGLDRELVGLPVNDKGEVNLGAIGPEKAAHFNRRMDELMHEGETMAEKMVRAHWDLVGAGSIELVKRGEISAERFAQVRAKVEAAKASGKTVPHPRPRIVPLTCEAVFK